MGRGASTGYQTRVGAKLENREIFVGGFQPVLPYWIHLILYPMPKKTVNESYIR
jgi:hypothetical protein